MMDTNNGLYIRHAPQLVANYTRFVDHLLHDPAMTDDRTDYFRQTPRATLLEEDRATLRQIMEKYRVSNRVTPEHPVTTATLSVRSNISGSEDMGTSPRT